MVRVASRGDHYGNGHLAPAAGAPVTSGLVLGAVEAPSGHDEYLGQLFLQMRHATGLPPVMIAARLGIETSVLALLESGAVLALPDWPETVRIVTAYAKMIGMDPSIPLHRIQSQRTSGAPVQQPVSSPGAPAMTRRPQEPLRPLPGQRVEQRTQPARQPIPSPPPGLMSPPMAPRTGPAAMPPARQAPPVSDGAASQGWIQLPPHPVSGHHDQRMRASQPVSPPRSQAAGPSGYAAPPFSPDMQQPGMIPPAPDRRPFVAMAPDAGRGAARQTGAFEAGTFVPPPPVVTLSAVNPLQPAARPARSETEAAQMRVMARHAQVTAPVKRRRAGRKHSPAAIALRFVTAPMIVVAGLWYTVQNPTVVHAALDKLPEPLPRIARAGMDIVLISTAPTKDGLRMISTGDPRDRKTDKLSAR